MIEFIRPTVPLSVCKRQPLPVRHTGYRVTVANPDPKTYLWRNIVTLMRDPTGDPSLDKVQKRTNIGRGTVQRIKEGDVSTRLDSLTTIAEAFGLPVWRLLHPELGAGTTVDYSTSALEVAQLYDRMGPEDRQALHRLLQAFQRPDARP